MAAEIFAERYKQWLADPTNVALARALNVLADETLKAGGQINVVVKREAIPDIDFHGELTQTRARELGAVQQEDGNWRFEFRPLNLEERRTRDGLNVLKSIFFSARELINFDSVLNSEGLFMPQEVVEVELIPAKRT